MQMEGVELCAKRGFNCSLAEVPFTLPVQIFSLFSYICIERECVCVYIYIERERVCMYIYTRACAHTKKKKLSLSSSLTLIQPLQILLCCATVALCVMLCTEDTQKQQNMTCTG